MRSARRTLLLSWAALFAATVAAFVPTDGRVPRPSVVAFATGFGDAKKPRASGVSSMGGQINWCPTTYRVADLPQADGTSGILDTNLPTRRTGATNPTGAVAVARGGGATYCYGVSCPRCKIPLTKAQLAAGSPPSVTCGFCRTTYSLRSGEKMETPPEAAGAGGFLGAIAKNLFSAQEGAALPIYQLGVKGGKVLIAVD